MRGLLVSGFEFRDKPCRGGEGEKKFDVGTTVVDMKREFDKVNHPVYFRYLGSHWIETLRDGLLKLARPQDFNDPYDCLGVCIGKFKVEALAKHFMDSRCDIYRQTLLFAKMNKLTVAEAAMRLASQNVDRHSSKMAETVRRRLLMDGLMYLLCFSSCPEDDSAHRLMWAHYANKCRGVRLGFHFNEGRAFKHYLNVVKYSSERAVLDLSLLNDVEEDIEYRILFENLITTKSIDWAYEREYRLMIADTHAESSIDAQGNILRFWRFNPDDLEFVDLGLDFDEKEIREVLSIVAKQYPNAKVRRLNLSPSTFAFQLEDLD